MIRKTCEECGHDIDTHFEVAKPKFPASGLVEYEKIRMACLGSRCDCPRYRGPK